MATEAVPRRLVQVTDVDAEGRRWPVLVTADAHVVRATERAIRERISEELGCPPPRLPSGEEVNPRKCWS